MATVSGRVIFDIDRTATLTGSDTGMQNVPVVLQNTTTNQLLTVLTDVNGNYSFINVPDGNYRIVEAYGTAGGVTTPGNFATAVVGSVPTGEDPLISFATSPPAGATNLDSLSPNTLFITVAGTDVTNEYFFDGPVKYTPIQSILDPCVTVSNTNLITAADNGTFGIFPAGTAVETGATPDPYLGIAPGFTYMLPSPPGTAPRDGFYTIQNIMTNMTINNTNTWWRIADHTAGDETGRFQAIGGANAGATFFQQTVAVTPNTNYLLSSWILNLIRQNGFAQPALGVEILDQNNNIIYQQTLGNSIPANTSEPEWKQIGTAINSGNNTSLTVKFISQGPAAAGNDFSIDDIALNPISIPNIIPVKTVSPTTATANSTDIVTYTVTLTNTCTNTLSSVTFIDTIPNGLTFVPGTVTINGSPSAASNPNTGFSVPDIPGGGSDTITFQARTSTSTPAGQINNSATMGYEYTPVQGGILNSYTQVSNLAPLQVSTSADLSIVKTSNPATVTAGNQVTYTLAVSNAGPSDAQSVTVTDVIPSSITNPQYSLDGGVTWNTWSGTVTLGTIAALGSSTVLIRGTVSSATTANITNTGVVSSTTSDPNPANNTSTVTTTVTTSADLSIVKTSNPATVIAGNQVIYTLALANAGPSDAQSVTITDVIPSSITNPQYSLNGGLTWSTWSGSLSLGTIAASGSRTVLLRGTVSSSTTANITNTSVISSPTTDPIPGNNTSTVTTGVTTLGDIVVTKTASSAFLTFGDIATYTVAVSNIGPSDSQNVVLNDVVPSAITGVQFSTDGGVTFNTWTGSVNLGTVAAGTTTTVLIRGTVGSSVLGAIANTASATSTTQDPNPSNNTSTSNATILAAILGLVKSVDKAYADIGDILTYSFTIQNTGNTSAINTLLTDLVPSGTSFVTGSTLVNGLPSGDNPVIGINIPSISAGTSATVSFKVRVDTIPTINPIPDTGTLTYGFIVDPTKPPVSKTVNSNTVTTQANHADLIGTNSSNFVKTVDKAYGDVGDVLTYTFNITNTGNMTATNIILTDTIPSGTTFVSGSVLVNGGASGDSPVTGINIPSIPAVGSATVSFKVSVDTIPTVNPIPDSATLAYKYTVNPSQPPVSATGNSNTVTTQVNNADLIGTNGTNFVKSASSDYVEVGGIITYTFTIKNTGNTVATNVIVTDIPPTGTTFIPGSTLINGLSSTDSPLTGINVPNILPGGSTTVSFKALVNTLPVPNPTVNTGTIAYKYLVDPSQPPVSGGGSSNPVNVKAEQISLQVAKSVDKTNATPGEVLTYSVVISNTGTVTAQNVIFTDPIPSGTTFVPNSVTVGGVPYMGVNPSVGINIGTIAPAAFVTVKFQVTVNNPSTVNPISNKGSVSYKAQLCQGCPLESRSTDSNATTSTIDIGQLTIVKTVDEKSTKVGSTITYTIVVTNTGTVLVQNGVLTDAIPSGAALVPNSVTVNGTEIPGSNPTIGISLGSISVGGQAVVTFKVLVVSSPCPPELINEAKGNFTFNLPNRTNTFTGSSISTAATTDVGLISFKQLSVDGNLTIPSQKPDAEDVLEAVASVRLVNMEVIKTPIGESYEGQNLTGWKAVIYGKLREKVRYVADEPTQSVHGAHFDIDFTTFIVLPNDFKKCCSIRLIATVEDIFVKLMDKRTIFSNITLLIEAKICY